jgi:crossover junction endodeoxyribonuclease RuvC
LLCPASSLTCGQFYVGISAKDFERMKCRLAGDIRQEEDISGPGAVHEVILGIDPSLRGTGYGVICRGRPHPRVLAQGTIKAAARWERSRCLVQIAQTLRGVLEEFRPTVCVVEGLFYAQNFQTALIMGEARGASLVAVAERGLEIYEIAPRKVKQAIVGYGAAQKLAVGRMVQRMLDLAEPPAADAADALALALTYFQETSRHSLTARKRI